MASDLYYPTEDETRKGFHLIYRWLEAVEQEIEYLKENNPTLNLVNIEESVAQLHANINWVNFNDENDI